MILFLLKEMGSELTRFLSEMFVVGFLGFSRSVNLGILLDFAPLVFLWALSLALSLSLSLQLFLLSLRSIHTQDLKHLFVLGSCLSSFLRLGYVIVLFGCISWVHA